MKTYIVSHFDTLTAAPHDIDLLQAFKAIRDGQVKDAIKLLHLALMEGNKEKSEAIKRGLPAISVSGRFKDKRKMDGLQEYVPTICLDIDHIGTEEARQLKKECATDPLVLAAFISPSGAGLKVFFQHAETQAEHKAVFDALADRFRHLYGIEVDMKARDIPRLCFYSYDPELYLNEDAIAFELRRNNGIEVKTNEGNKSIAIGINKSIAPATDLQKCLEWTESKLKYQEGNRNNFLFLFACTCNRKGIEEQDCRQFCLDQFDLSEEETEKTISSAYRNHCDEFGEYQVAKFTKLAKSIPTQSSAGATGIEEKKKSNLQDQAKPNLLLHTPSFPDSVYQDLPELLTKTCGYFNEPRYKDVHLLSCLTVLSHFVDHMCGSYHNQLIHPNLYCFVIAPSGVGKKNIQFAGKLASQAHKRFMEQYEADYARFEKEKQQYEDQVKSNNKSAGLEFPKEPKRKTVFLPADSSHASMVQQLAQNGNRGLMFEAEADVLSSATKQEWGNYSTLLRLLHGHEPYQLARKKDKEFIYIDNGMLALFLAGTANQALRLLPNAEDGLFTRFLFYLFDMTTGWKSPSPTHKGNLDDIFYQFGSEIMDLETFMQKHETEMFFDKEGWDRFDAFFTDKLLDHTKQTDDFFKGSVHRCGMAAFRICMILTALRKFEHNDTAARIQCDMRDIETALQIIEVSLEHTQLLYVSLPEAGLQAKFRLTNKKEEFLEAMPERFQRKEAIELGKEYNLKEKTVDNLLRAVKGSILFEDEENGFGWYRKNNVHD